MYSRVMMFNKHLRDNSWLHLLILNLQWLQLHEGWFSHKYSAQFEKRNRWVTLFFVFLFFLKLFNVKNSILLYLVVKNKTTGTLDFFPLSYFIWEQASDSKWHTVNKRAICLPLDDSPLDLHLENTVYYTSYSSITTCFSIPYPLVSAGNSWMGSVHQCSHSSHVALE